MLQQKHIIIDLNNGLPTLYQPTIQTLELLRHQRKMLDGIWLENISWIVSMVYAALLMKYKYVPGNTD